MAGSQNLTAAERRVIKIAALGYSAKRVAAELYISPRTVETHIGHIYQKLGIKSHDELIDWAAAEKSKQEFYTAQHARELVSRAERAADIIDRTMGWQHLRRYSQMSEEWMNKLRDGLARNIVSEVSETGIGE